MCLACTFRHNFLFANVSEEETQKLVQLPIFSKHVVLPCRAAKISSSHSVFVTVFLNFSLKN